MGEEGKTNIPQIFLSTVLTMYCRVGNARLKIHRLYYQLFNNAGGDGKTKSRGKVVQLKCTHCKETFSGAWDLMFHVQNAHSLNIYTLGDQRLVSTAISYILCRKKWRISMRTGNDKSAFYVFFVVEFLRFCCNYSNNL